ncbi:MAG: hypothetical protein WAV38_34285 [Xanthobacteraceae bacterium]
MPDTSDSIPATATKIEINLSRLPQLFNSLDPSPFHERDLDHDAEDYIVGSAEEASRQYPLALVIHLPADQLPAQGLPDVREAIHNYFAYRRDQESRRLRLLFRDGRIALLIGLSFLFCCVLLRELAFSFGNDSASDIFGEGMLIIGWVDRSRRPAWLPVCCLGEAAQDSLRAQARNRHLTKVPVDCSADWADWQTASAKRCLDHGRYSVMKHSMARALAARSPRFSGSR